MRSARAKCQDHTQRSNSKKAERDGNQATDHIQLYRRRRSRARRPTRAPSQPLHPGEIRGPARAVREGPLRSGLEVAGPSGDVDGVLKESFERNDLEGALVRRSQNHVGRRPVAM